MKNLFALKERPGDEAPPEVYGIRPYILALSASWACKMTPSTHTVLLGRTSLANVLSS